MHEQLPLRCYYAGFIWVSCRWFLRQPLSTFSYLILFSSSREPNANHDTIAPYLLKGPVDENGICFDFIKEAIKRFDDDEAFPAIFNNAMVKLSTQLSGLSMSDEYKPYVQVSLLIISFNNERQQFAYISLS